MKLSKPNLKKKLNTPSISLKVTERDKKLLAGFGVLLIIVLSYYLLYQPMSTKAETLNNEKIKVDSQLAVAHSDLKNETQILQDYTTVLDMVNKNTSPFFPKVYPYKDRYVLLLEKAVTNSGATTNGITFTDPEVGGVFQPKQDKPFILPGYALQDLAKRIDSANPNAIPEVDMPAAAATASAPADKSLPADAMLRLPATLVVKGSYAQIREVITNLENLKRAVAIEGIYIGSEKDSGLKADITLSFYAVKKVDNSADAFNQWTLQGSYGKADLFN